jgi:hypothetical protein
MLKTVSNQIQESTYVPTWGGGSITVNFARYTRVGNLVTVFFDVLFGSSLSVADSDLSLPTTGAVSWGTGQINFTDYGTSLVVNIDPSGDKILFRSALNAGNVSRLAMSGIRVIASASYYSE